MSWISLRVSAPAEDRGRLLETLFDAGAMAVEEQDENLVTHFPDELDAESLRRQLAEVSPLADIVFTPLVERDWSERWRAGIRAHTVGELTVVPPWLADGRPMASTIVIEPAMAFGTGEHESTRCALRLLQAIVRPGDVVADLGSGSAVLAIGAAKRGAARVAAIELDADAISNAEHNVRVNGVADVVTVIEGDASILLPLVAPVQGVLANITAGVIRSLLPVIRDALVPGRDCVFAGMLVEERTEMLAAFAAGSWSVLDEASEGDWWAVTIRPR